MSGSNQKPSFDYAQDGSASGSEAKPVTRHPKGAAKRNQAGKIAAVSISEKKGTKKRNVKSVELKEDFGIVGDAHAGTKDRQISLLAIESIEKMQNKGLKVKPGDFAENITTEGMDLVGLKRGTKLKIGKGAMVEISQIGKVCITRCSIYYQAGDCVMPREGIFARVLKGGIVKPGDEILVDG